MSTEVTVVITPNMGEEEPNYLALLRGVRPEFFEAARSPIKCTRTFNAVFAGERHHAGINPEWLRDLVNELGQVCDTATVVISWWSESGVAFTESVLMGPYSFLSYLQPSAVTA